MQFLSLDRKFYKLTLFLSVDQKFYHFCHLIESFNNVIFGLFSTFDLVTKSIRSFLALDRKFLKPKIPLLELSI
jgi:hypothetical protein